MEPALRDIVARALEEDRAWNDITSSAIVSADAKGTARLIAREPCVFAGLDAFAATFAVLDPSLQIESKVSDGWAAAPDDELARVTGSLRSILAAERTALNFAQRLSGIATLTRAYRDAAGERIELRDTRKTTPGLRLLEKRAVVAGGGTGHRADLAQAILIKDNHIAALGGDIGAAVSKAKASGVHVEVECESLEQCARALDAGADELLLDNMAPALLRDAVTLVGGRAKTEASGGVTLETIAAIAATGVDSVSVGALTHSARAIDLSLDVESI